MIEVKENRYDFLAADLPADTFTVVSFTGLEGLSRPYRFDLLLASEKEDLDSTGIIKKKARLIIHQPGNDLFYHGWPLYFEQGRQAQGLTFYRVRLVPWYSLLANFFGHRVLLDLALPEIFSETVRAAGLEPADHELRLQEDYPTVPYLCQYGESHFDFLNRLMERHGVYYFFEQTAAGERLVVTDSSLAHEARPGQERLIYAPPSGLDAERPVRMVHDFTCQVKRGPGKVLVADYNPAQPGLKIQGQADVPPGGPNRVYLYGRHVQTPEEAEKLARIKVQEFQAGARVFRGRSLVPAVSAGYLYELTGHDRADFNAKYLVTEVRHQGRQTGPLLSGLTPEAAEDERKPFYENTFQAIPADVQYRPETRTLRPKAAGVVTAHVEAAGSGRYAELDDQGRYKMKPAFDLSDRTDGKSSHWVRMAQPYAGRGGFHFPLHKGAEIVLTHIDGDPDRPVIAAALPNVENQSPVTSGNQARGILRTADRNQISLDDTQGAQGILLAVPANTTKMNLGSTEGGWWEVTQEAVKIAAEALGELAKSIWDANAEDSGWKPIKPNHDGFALSTNSSFGKYVGQDLKIQIGGNSFALLLGSEWTVVIGFKHRTVIGLCSVVVLGGRIELHLPEKWTWCNVKAKTNEQLLEMTNEKIEAAEEKERAYDEKIRLAQEKAEAINTRNEAVLDKIRLIDEKVQAVNSSTEAIESKISAADRLLEATNTKIGASQEEISTVDNLVDATNIRLHQYEALIKTAGEQVEVVAGLRAETQELKVTTGDEQDL
ncbi:MAG: type VI secretion system tip protein TssI/VgrG [Thermodesulfobacteriota bacterium]